MKKKADLNKKNEVCYLIAWSKQCINFIAIFSGEIHHYTWLVARETLML